MQTNVQATSGDLVQALTPSRIYWKQLSARYEHLDELVSAIACTPLFQHSYFTLYGKRLEEMLQDIRSATGLLVCNLLTQKELQAFSDRRVVHYINHGLALAVPHLRKRLDSIDQSRFVEVIRMTCFSFIFKQIAEDLSDPRPLLTDLVKELEIEPSQQMSLIASVVSNICPASRSFTVH